MSSMKLKLEASGDLPAEETQINDLGMIEATLQSMLADDDQFNVKVISGSYEKLACKVLLSGRVPFFKDALMHDNTEAKGTIEVPPEISADTTKVIVDYVYFIQPKVTLKNAQSLLEAAGFFRIEDLWEFCDQFIAKRIVLTLENCIEVQAYAAVRSAKQLAKAAGQFILENLADFFGSDRFKQLSQTQLESFLSLDEIDGLPSEEKFWEALVEWVKADEENRKELMPQLIKYVRLPSLSTRYIIRNILPHPYLNSDPRCQQIIQALMCFKVDPGDEESRQACAAEFKLSKRSSQRQASCIYVAYKPACLTYPTVQALRIPGGVWEDLTGMNNVPPATLGRTAILNNCMYFMDSSDDKLCIYNPASGSCSEVEGDQDRPPMTLTMPLLSDGEKLFVCCLNRLQTDTEVKFWSYDPAVKIWKDGKVSIGKHYRTSLVAVCGVVQKNSYDNFFLCYFGCISNIYDNKSMFLYLVSPKTGQFIRGCPIPSKQMLGYAVASYDGKVIVAGGTDGTDGLNGTALSTVKMYDATLNEWCSLPDMISPRSIFEWSFDLVVANDCLYAIGGDTFVEYLDLNSVKLQWRPCSSQILGNRNEINSVVVLDSAL